MNKIYYWIISLFLLFLVIVFISGCVPFMENSGMIDFPNEERLIKSADVSANKYAVIVGISHSKGGSNYKVNGDNTARLLVSILKNAGWKMKNIKLLTNRQATNQAISDAIAWLKSIENENSTIVIMFACHGNATGVKLWDLVLSHKRIKNDLLNLKSKKQLVIIATCHSGGAVYEGSDGISLAQINRIVISSCAEETVDPCTHHYTRWAEAFLLRGIKESKADANKDGKVSIQEAFEYAGSRMSDLYGQEFYF